MVNEIRKSQESNAKIHAATNTASDQLLPAILDRGVIAALIGDDKELRKVRRAIMSKKQEDEETLDKLWKQYMKDLSVQDGCLFLGHQLVIPEQIRNAIIQRRHADHCGAKIMNARAEYIWMPKINRRIEAAAKNGKACTKTAKNLKALMAHKDEGERDKPIEPNEELEIDFAGPIKDQKYLLCAIDRYSNYPFN